MHNAADIHSHRRAVIGSTFIDRFVFLLRLFVGKAALVVFWFGRVDFVGWNEVPCWVFKVKEFVAIGSRA